MSSRAHERFLKKCHGNFERSREPFVLNYQTVYGKGDKMKLPPLWVMANTMDFGQVVTLYKGASVEIRADLASKFGVSTRVLESWLLSINTVRNICAHHGRLWNREIGTKPMISRGKDWHLPYEVLPNRMFGMLVILKYLTDVISPKTSLTKRLGALMADYPDIGIQNMGFLPGWENCPLWTSTEKPNPETR